MNSSDVNFYNILGVDKNASEDEIKKAFRKFSKKYHPDMQHGKSDAEKKEAEEMFKKGQAAYECLSDPEKRKIYDEYGIEGLQGHAQQGGFSGGMGDNLRDFMQRHFGFSWGFGDEDDFNPFGRRKSYKRAPSNTDPEDGTSYRIKMEIDLEDVIFGAEKSFTMDGFNVCPDCHGHKCDGYEECQFCHGSGMNQKIQGNMIFQSTCQHCGGSGYSPKNICATCGGEGRIRAKRQYKVKIPKGMPEGGQLRVRGGGVPGVNGGTDGDLFIVITTKKHPIFRRNPDYGDLRLEMDLYVNPMISFCGGYVSIPTPYEMKMQYLSAGVKNGQTIVLPEDGIRTDERSGPLVVHIIYDTINSGSLTQQEKDTLSAAYDVVSKNKDCLINSRQQYNELNYKTKLPWIISLDK